MNLSNILYNRIQLENTTNQAIIVQKDMIVWITNCFRTENITVIITQCTLHDLYTY